MIRGLRPTAGKLEGSHLGPWVANGTAMAWPPPRWSWGNRHD